MLKAERVTVQYPGQFEPAVRGVNVELVPGQMVVVAGPNGSGKSSLFGAMLAHHELSSGKVTLDDRDVIDWPRREFAQRVAALPQSENQIFPLQVREAVMLGRWASLGPIAAISADDHRAVDIALERTRLTTLSTRTTDTLSGGEWQLVRLARALAAEPKLLLLDEPGAALDLAHEMSLFELLRELVADGLGVLAITHHLNLATRYADRVVLLNRGALISEGTPAEVLTAPMVSEVFGWPVAVHELADGAPHLVPLRLDEIESDNPSNTS